jgi:plastocyanin
MSLHWKKRGGAVALMALVVALGSGTVFVRRGLAAAEAQSAVTIDNYAFGPTSLTVRRGATVTWTNQDDDVHTVKSDGGPETFKSSALDTGDKFDVTFDKVGTYAYICSVHPYMHGTIVVQ